MVRQPGRVTCGGMAWAGQGTIVTKGRLQFGAASTAGNAAIFADADGVTFFGGDSTAANATVTANAAGATIFSESASGGEATIVTRCGGETRFVNTSTGGNARIITEARGTFDMSRLSLPRMTPRSNAGARNY